MQIKVKTGLPQMYNMDFQARACTTSRWLCEEMVKGSPRSPLPIATLGCKSKPLAAGASVECGATSVASTATPDFARLPGLEGVLEDSATTENGSGTPLRLRTSATLSGSTTGPDRVLVSMCTLRGPEDRGSVCSIMLIAVSEADSPKPSLKLIERLMLKPKEAGMVAACATGVQEVWPEFSPRVPKTNRGKPGLMMRSSRRILSAARSPRRAAKLWMLWGMRLALPKRDVCISSKKLRWTSSSAPCGLIITVPVLSSRKKGTERL